MQSEQRHIEAHDPGIALFFGAISIHGMVFMHTIVITQVSDTDSCIYSHRGIRDVLKFTPCRETPQSGR